MRPVLRGLAGAVVGLTLLGGLGLVSGQNNSNAPRAGYGDLPPSRVPPRRAPAAPPAPVVQQTTGNAPAPAGAPGGALANGQAGGASYAGGGTGLRQGSVEGRLVDVYTGAQHANQGLRIVSRPAPGPGPAPGGPQEPGMSTGIYAPTSPGTGGGMAQPPAGAGASAAGTLPPTPPAGSAVRQNTVIDVNRGIIASAPTTRPADLLAKVDAGAVRRNLEAGIPAAVLTSDGRLYTLACDPRPLADRALASVRLRGPVDPAVAVAVPERLEVSEHGGFRALAVKLPEGAAPPVRTAGEEP